MAPTKNHFHTLYGMEHLGIRPAKRGDIRVEALEARVIPKVPFPHKHDFFQIVIITSGGGWHYIDMERYPVDRNHLFFLKPGQVHSWDLSRSIHGYVIEFTIESLNDAGLVDILENLPNYCTVDLKGEMFSVNFIKMMEQEYHLNDADARLSLQFYLRILLLRIFRNCKAQLGSSVVDDDMRRRFFQLLEKHYRQQHNLEFYAKQLKTTPKALSAHVQHSMGKSAKEVILQRCLLEAKRLLSYSDLSVAEIGYILGFEDPNYFSRFLKQNLKTSAVQFRKLIKESQSENLSRL